MNCKCCKNKGDEKNIVLPASTLLRGKERDVYDGRIIVKNTLICDNCNKKFTSFY